VKEIRFDEKKKKRMFGAELKTSAFR